MNTERLQLALVVIVGVIVGTFAGFYLRGCAMPVIRTVDREVVVTIPGPPVIVQHDSITAIIDTMYVENEGGAEIGQVEAYIDTTINEDSIMVRYFFPPDNFFALDIRRAPYTFHMDTTIQRLDSIEVRTETNWQAVEIAGGAGIIIGGALYYILSGK